MSLFRRFSLALFSLSLNPGWFNSYFAWVIFSLFNGWVPNASVCVCISAHWLLDFIYVKLMIAYNNLMHKHLFNVSLLLTHSVNVNVCINSFICLFVLFCVYRYTEIQVVFIGKWRGFFPDILLSLHGFLFVRSSSAFNLIILLLFRHVRVCVCRHTAEKTCSEIWFMCVCVRAWVDYFTVWFLYAHV